MQIMQAMTQLTPLEAVIKCVRECGMQRLFSMFPEQKETWYRVSSKNLREVQSNAEEGLLQKSFHL
ncbi:hypothetical protein ANCCAN_29259 [Ancylostoma caninum]|uniref:Uncharacterized protein n=1 Tax=Ancylostoma caninum TaxID=29170 RepID=A0A368EYW9_ANCCA|nr:hypothetical protein ANCCAN_29259 [Ancylostoma caninum]